MVEARAAGGMLRACPSIGHGRQAYVHSTACLVSITTRAPVPVPPCETRRSSALPKGRVPAMIIPHRRLSPAALRGVIEAFITREGTDYGLHEVPLATKVAQVRHQLDAGTAILV